MIILMDSKIGVFDFASTQGSLIIWAETSPAGIIE